MVQFRPMNGGNDTNFLGATTFDKGVAEESCFETVMAPERIAGRAPYRSGAQPRTVDEGIAILQPPGRAQGTLPGFGYWLLVALAAISVFWISGGYALFSR